MRVVRRDVIVRQGSVFELTVIARNDDGTVKDLTGFTGRMQIRSTVDASSTLLDATTANGMITITGPSGKITVSVPADVTTAMNWTTGVYDLEVLTTATNVFRVAEGNASLSREVTR